VKIENVHSRMGLRTYRSARGPRMMAKTADRNR
jgi:hypothetical protein